MAIRSSWSEPQSAPGLVFADCIELLHLQLQIIESFWFQCWPSGGVPVLSHLLCCCKRVFAMTSDISWQNSISLCPASFCTPRPNLPVTPGVSWLPTFAFQSPYNEKGIFFGMLVLKGLVDLHRTVQLQLLQCYWLGHRLGLLWYWMVCLGNQQIILLFLRLHPSTAFWTLLLTMMATPFPLRDSCPQ